MSPLTLEMVIDELTNKRNIAKYEVLRCSQLAETSEFDRLGKLKLSCAYEGQYQALDDVVKILTELHHQTEPMTLVDCEDCASETHAEELEEVLRQMLYVLPNATIFTKDGVEIAVHFVEKGYVYGAKKRIEYTWHESEHIRLIKLDTGSFINQIRGSKVQYVVRNEHYRTDRFPEDTTL